MKKILDEEVLSDEQLEDVVGGAITAKRISWYGSANNNENKNFNLGKRRVFFTKFCKKNNRQD